MVSSAAVNWFYFTLGVLATYRLSLMVSRESGPARIFRKLRNLPPPKSATREGLQCQLCLAVWFGAASATFFWWRNMLPGIEWPLYWLAFSAGAVIIHLHTSKDL